MNYQNGMHQLSNYDYHRATAVSRSQLMRLAKSPQHFRHYLPDDFETDSMLIGSAVHTMLLEPDLYNKTYAIAPNADKRTKEGKRLWATAVALHAGKRLLSMKQASIINDMVAALKAHPVAARLLTNASLIEQSIFFNHQSTGLQCKSRTDFIAGYAAVDLKTTSDATYRAFQQSASKYGYYLQAAMTQAALKSIDIDARHHVIIAIESASPYFIKVYRLDEVAMQAGYRKFDRLMQRYKQVINSPVEDDYGIETLYAPSWELDDE